MKIWKCLAASSLLLLLCSPLACADDVALGSDYFQTGAGTQFDFGPGIGVVNFQGLPNTAHGNTDTIIQRQADATIGGPPIPIQITDLSLQSTAPVNIGGSFFDVFVTLDPAHLSNDTGTLTVMGSAAGGTFDDTLDVFFDAHFAPIGGGSATDVFGSIALSQTGASWSPTDPGTVLVPGLDCDNAAGSSACSAGAVAADQAANSHTGLAAGEVDFFVVSPETESGPGGSHRVRDASVPEPASLILLGSGLLGLAGSLGKKLSSLLSQRDQRIGANGPRRGNRARA